LKRSDPRRGISVIDIGCGLGEFLRVCKSSDLNVIGLEVTKDIVDVLIKEGFDVLNYSLLEFSKKQRRFDWVTCLDVIEHLNNPIETIESLVNLVNEGGLLLIQSPNSKSISKYGEKAYSLTVDREHLNYFNPDTLIRIFSQYGFTLVKKKFLPENSSSVLKNSKKQFIPAEIRPYRSNINITGLRKIIKKMPAPIRGILRSFVQIKRILLAYNDIKNETAHEFVLLFKRVKTS
jgi:SAM-dependent methyltransferase